MGADNKTDQLDSGIAHLAAQFLGARFQGPHKDKRIARELGISPGMAKLLRAGRCWTVARLDQAVQLYGPSFTDAIFGQLRPADNVETQLEAISAQLGELLSVARGGGRLTINDTKQSLERCVRTAAAYFSCRFISSISALRTVLT